MAIKITSDRMIDMTTVQLEELDISTIGCYVNMGGKSYSDLDDVTPKDVFNHFIKTGEIAKTAAKSPELYEEFFKPFVDNGDTVIHFSCSSGISAIANHAKIAADRIGNVYAIDTLTLSGGISLLARHAIDLIEGGETDAKKIYESCLAKREKIQGSFLLDSLDFLYKGGRCSGFQFYAANFLKLKPVIYMNPAGKMVAREKCKGNINRAITQYVKNTFEKYPNPDLSRLCINHTCEDIEIYNFLLETIASYHKFENIYMGNISCNCFIHSGKNTVSMFYFMK